MVQAYNCTKHDSTNFTPNELMFRIKLRLAIDEQQSTEYTDYIQGLKDRIAVAYDLTSKPSRCAQIRQKSHYDKKQRDAVVQPSDRILVKVVAFDGKHKINY